MIKKKRNRKREEEERNEMDFFFGRIFHSEKRSRSAPKLGQSRVFFIRAHGTFTSIRQSAVLGVSLRICLAAESGGVQLVETGAGLGGRDARP